MTFACERSRTGLRQSCLAPLALCVGLAGCAVDSGQPIQLAQLSEPPDTLRTVAAAEPRDGQGAWNVQVPFLLAPEPKPARLYQTGSLPEERRDAIAKIGKPYQVAGRWYTPGHQPDYQASGMASWYGPEFHGRKTANGEIYNRNRLTAAHPTLPMPSYVRVTNQDNGRSVVVRINDRGPYTRGRIIDVSQRAADLLGFIGKGTAKVSVAYVGPAPLDADDRYEQAFLAKQPWFAGGPRLTAVPTTGWEALSAQ